jgi:hypothetical protein
MRWVEDPLHFALSINISPNCKENFQLTERCRGVVGDDGPQHAGIRMPKPCEEKRTRLGVPLNIIFLTSPSSHGATAPQWGHGFLIIQA